MKLLFILFLVLTLYGSSVKTTMLELYQNKEYSQSCDMGFVFLNDHNNIRDEEYLSIYAFSCLNADFIDRLSVAVSGLKFSPESRSNGAYFSIIIMQKKLLYHALLDGYDLSSLNLPTTDYVLSKVFDLYVKSKKELKDEFYMFEDENDSRLKYKLYLLKNSKKIPKMIIEEFYNSVSIKQHVYW